MITRLDWLQGRVTAAEERDLFDRGEISECDYEFGHHDHDDRECAQTLAGMNGGDDDWLAYEQDAYTREHQEESLGRPLLPNEY